MASMKAPGPEQRQHERFACNGDVFVALVRTDEPVTMGKVMDISLGGLGIHYIAPNKLDNAEYDTQILGWNKHKAQVDRIKSKVVYDTKQEEIGDLSIRRCGVRFENCSPQNLADLLTVIGLFTPGPVPNIG